MESDPTPVTPDERLQKLLEEMDDEDLQDASVGSNPDPACEAEETRDLSPISIEQFVEAQAMDNYCQQVRKEVDLGTSKLFQINKPGLLVRIAPLDRTAEVVVPASLRAKVLNLCHYPRLLGHPVGTRMYQTLRQTFHWPSMSMDVYACVRACPPCARERMCLRKHSSFLKLFLPTRPLEFVAIDILGPLARTTQGNRFLLVISNRFLKLTKMVPPKRITAYTIARAFRDQWIFVCIAPVYFLSENGRQFTAKFFQEVYTKLGIQNLFTTTYHPQTNGQVERLNRTILAGLRHFASEDQKHWDVFSNAVTFAYNTQVHSSTGWSPFELDLSRPKGPLAMQAIASSSVAGEQPQQVRQRFIEHISHLLAKTRETLSASQARYKRNFDSGVNPAAPLVPGQAVYLRRERKAEDKLLPSHKLKPKVYRPFEVIPTNSHTLTIYRDGLLDKVSKDRVVLAPVVEGTLGQQPA